MTPSIAALLGKWFWWPQRVRQRPVPQPRPGPRAESEPDATDQLSVGAGLQGDSS
jgi:RND superfamily putative drug exporter